MSKQNKFTNLREAIRSRKEDDGAGETVTPAREAPSDGKRPGPGRPRTGKRSNPNFLQVTALIPKRVYEEVQVKLIKDKSHGDFSDVVGNLLEGWLAR
jgi:hypothetical protein